MLGTPFVLSQHPSQCFSELTFWRITEYDFEHAIPGNGVDGIFACAALPPLGFDPS
jgi:hypothetical protein